jgi:2,5-diketo-D-gluconate reductase B
MQNRIWQGVAVPTIGLGTWELRGAACREAVEHALAIGYRHLDTAQAYENEAEVGVAIANSGLARDDIFLTTKVRPRYFQRDELLRSTAASLKALRVEAVDLLLLHWPNREVSLAETLAALHEARAQGMARHVGVSNFNPSMLAQAVAAGPTMTNQIEFHPFLAQHRMLELADQHDLLITAYAPVARGKVNQEPLLHAIGSAYGKSPSQVALRWLVQQPRTVAIPKAASPANQLANLSIFDFELSDDEMTQISALARGERLVDNPDLDWEG